MRYDNYRTHHSSRRLRGYDYTQQGAYFLTICTHERACLLGEIVEGRMVLNEIGTIVDKEWRRTEEIRGEITLDAFVVMPNHVHGIVVIGAGDDRAIDRAGHDVSVDGERAVATHGRASLLHRKPKSLGSLVAGFKSAATRRINRMRKTPGAKVWQKNYFDRILRNEKQSDAVRQYIKMNPERWSDDVHFAVEK